MISRLHTDDSLHQPVTQSKVLVFIKSWPISICMQSEKGFTKFEDLMIVNIK